MSGIQCLEYHVWNKNVIDSDDVQVVHLVASTVRYQTLADNNEKQHEAISCQQDIHESNGS